LQRWRATSNGLEGLAALHNDTLLCLDELAQVAPTEAGEIAYMLANGTGKTRSSRDGSARRKATWRVLFLSAGEIGLAEHMRTAGKSVRAGQEVRLVDIPADAGYGHGLFEKLHGCPDGASFSRQLSSAARAYHGTAARVFLEKLGEGLAGLVEAVEGFRKEFLSETLPANADGQVHRVAGRFALVAAGGELATALGVTGWSAGEIIQGVKRCFEAWLVGRGGNGPAEERQALSQVRRFFEAHGEARFSPWGNSDRVTVNRAGFRREAEGKTEWFILPETFRTEVCQGLDHRFVAKLLVSRGWIKPEDGNSTTVKPRLPGMGPTRCYHFVSMGNSDAD
ncbi:MAG: DUF927 domain-containing protein, partial [Magnetococcus sp. YQC-9]